MHVEAAHCQSPASAQHWDALAERSSVERGRGLVDTRQRDRLKTLVGRLSDEDPRRPLGERLDRLAHMGLPLGPLRSTRRG